MLSERLWLFVCGTDANSIVTFNWEFFVDLSLVAGSYFLPQKVFLHSPTVTRGAIEFSLVYFSLINGWFLYAHHYASRFQEASRLHWLLVWLFIIATVYSVNHASLDTYLEFSLGMIYMRLTVFLLLARVACYIDRAQPISALLAVFIGDAIICYALSAASDVQSAAILWGFVAVTELHVDLFLAVGLRGPLQVPFHLESTLERFYSVILAPVGAVGMNSLSRTKTKEEIVFAVLSITLMTLLGMLYCAFKGPATIYMRRRSHFEKASLLILLKLLGLFLWVAGACLMIEPDIDKKSDMTDLMGWMVGASLLCFLNLRIVAGRRHDIVEAIWVIFAFAPFILIRVVRDCSPLLLLSVYVTFVSILYMTEGWYNIGALETSVTTTSRLPTGGGPVIVADSSSGNTTSISSVVAVTPPSTSGSTEQEPLIPIRTVDLHPSV
jgi:hypothetical protein